MNIFFFVCFIRISLGAKLENWPKKICTPCMPMFWKTAGCVSLGWSGNKYLASMMPRSSRCIKKTEESTLCRDSSVWTIRPQYAEVRAKFSQYCWSTGTRASCKMEYCSSVWRKAKVRKGNSRVSSHEVSTFLSSSCERNLRDYAIRFKVSESEVPNTVKTLQEKIHKFSYHARGSVICWRLVQVLSLI